MNKRYRIPDGSHWPHDMVDTVVQGDALKTLTKIPSNSIALIVTSPPYWNTVDYGMDGQIGQSGYDEYIQDMVEIWHESSRILIPNGKLAIIAPIMPVPKKQIGDQHTRHLKNIAFDIEASILQAIPSLYRYSLFVWRKQTTTKMFGSYPYPPNILEDNTVEFINVYVKEGKPLSVSNEVKDANRLTQKEWINLSMQVWPMIPEDGKRIKGHPAPFPVALPQRLIRMYTFKQSNGFEGDIVLDVFNGSGTTTLAAKAMGRRYIGIELNPYYCGLAETRLAQYLGVDPNEIMLHPDKVLAATKGG